MAGEAARTTVVVHGATTEKEHSTVGWSFPASSKEKKRANQQTREKKKRGGGGRAAHTVIVDYVAEVLQRRRHPAVQHLIDLRHNTGKVGFKIHCDLLGEEECLTVFWRGSRDDEICVYVCYSISSPVFVFGRRRSEFVSP